MSRGTTHSRLLRAPAVAVTALAFAASAAQAGPRVMIDAGAYHACGVRADQTIACWGWNTDGQATASAGGFTTVSSGLYHACGVRADQTAACWGSNGEGQTTAPAGSFTAVSAGNSHTCGLRADQTIACWGHNSSGQTTAPAGSFTAVSAGGAHTCGLRADQTIVCWGNDGLGQATAPAGSFAAVSAGGGHTCGLRADQTIACWGRNGDGESTAPAGSFAAVSAGFFHTCGVRADQTIACWGSNGEGQTSVPASFAEVMGASAGALGFASQPQGTVSAPQSVTITNSGGYKLEIYATTFTGPAAGDFLISSSSCLGRVDPGDTCTLTVRFAPAAAGERVADLVLEATSAPNRLAIALTGTGGSLPAGPKGDPGPPGAGIKGAKVLCKKVRVKRRKAKPRCRLVLTVTRSVARVTVAGRTRRARSGRVVIPLASRPKRRTARAKVRGRDGSTQTIEIALK